LAKALAADDDAVVFRFGPRLEGFIDDAAIAGAREPSGRGIDAHEADAGRDAEGRCRLVLERGGHEIAEDRRRVVRALLTLAKAVRIVEPDIDAGDEIGREAHEPVVLIVVRGAGLAGKRLADSGDDASGAALNDALQY